MRMPERADNNESASIPQDLYAYWSRSPATFQVEIEKPEGLVGALADAIFNASIRPVPKIALSASIALLAGISGRAFSVSNTGLNQYVFVEGKTGIGKDAIASGIELAVEQVANNPACKVPAIADFIGPGDFTSYAGGYQALCGPSPSIVCVFGEYGKKLAEAATGKNPHLIGVSRLLLQAYSKSGEGEVLRPISYADRDRKTPSVHRPALTIIAEMTPDIYGIMDEGMISEGTLPRALWVSVPDERPARNRNPQKAFPGSTLDGLATLAAISLTNASQQLPPMKVGFADDGSGFIFDCFDQWCDNEIRESGSGAVRELWNRAHLKALKLAALQAVGVNPHSPLITARWAHWAIDFVHNQTVRLASKFNNGEVGEEQGNEAKQISEVIRVIREYTHNDYDAYAAKYNCSFDMHKHGVVPEAYIQRRLITLKAFKPYATRSIKQAIKSLLEADELREMSPSQMLEKYGTKPRAFVVATPHRFK